MKKDNKNSAAIGRALPISDWHGGYVCDFINTQYSTTVIKLVDGSKTLVGPAAIDSCSTQLPPHWFKRCTVKRDRDGVVVISIEHSKTTSSQKEAD